MTTPLKSRPRATLPLSQMTAIPDDLSEYIVRDARMVRDLVWEDFIKKKRAGKYFSDLGGVDHQTLHPLRQYCNRGGGCGFFLDISGKRDSQGQP